MIKIGIRQNLIYPTAFAFSSLFREIEYIFMNKPNYTENYFLTLIMFISEFISGLLFFRYHLNFVNGRKSIEDSTIMGIKLVKIKNVKQSIPDSNLVIYIYIFLIAFFDFSNFVSKFILLPNYLRTSNISYSLSINIRSTVVLTFYSSFFSYFLLKIPIHKHQKCSLILLGFCFLYFLFTEFFISFLNDKSIDLVKFALIIVMTFFSQLFFSFIDIIEKYLLEYDLVNPFQMLMVEGIFGIILTIISIIIWAKPFDEIEKLHKKYEGELLKIFILILFLIMYLVLSGFKNIYRVVTNKIYNPTTKNLFDVLMDPLLLVIYFFIEGDLQNMEYNHDRWIIFICNLIVSLLIIFSCCVYNELFVLFCCGLEYNTHREISKRADYSRIKELNPVDDNDSDDGEYDK